MCPLCEVSQSKQVHFYDVKYRTVQCSNKFELLRGACGWLYALVQDPVEFDSLFSAYFELNTAKCISSQYPESCVFPHHRE